MAEGSRRRANWNDFGSTGDSSKKHHGTGTQGKADGTDAMTEMPLERSEGNTVLSNRDKASTRKAGAWTAKPFFPNSFRTTLANRLPDDGQ
jgi:hypothetical protein